MQLGTPTFDSPLGVNFVRDDAMTYASPLLSRAVADSLAFECAGPRAKLFFDPAVTRVGVVTCGGLCPGTNNVLRALLLELHHNYGVREVLGFRYGLRGIVDAGIEPLRLTPETVRHVHRLGGSVLGSSRGRQDTNAIVDELERRGLSVLFMIGGNGTMRAARAVVGEIARRGLRIAVVGIPKTIDDDVAFIDKSFGFDTAVEHARAAIDAAHVEALGARNGVGVVKVMGRDAGFVAASAALASGEANFVLLPEARLTLEGNDGLFSRLERRLARRTHAVIVVAEGCAAQTARQIERDASGNARYASRATDIGPWLCDAIERHFSHTSAPITLKYIDPSYTIRAAPANASDAIYSTELARHAVHAAMAGNTDVLVGRCHGIYAHVPLELVVDNVPHVGSETRTALEELTGAPS
ncbi:MAG TPA: ATP-dependent 6-phosphofructokinase [Polyangiaceae bacterium]|jgi:6-phosphofructokinase 1